MGHLLLPIVMCLLLYLGYKDDFERDKKGFVFTVIGVLAFGGAFFLLSQYSSLLAYLVGIVLYAISQYLKQVLRTRLKSKEK